MHHALCFYLGREICVLNFTAGTTLWSHLQQNGTAISLYLINLLIKSGNTVDMHHSLHFDLDLYSNSSDTFDIAN